MSEQEFSCPESQEGQVKIVTHTKPYFMNMDLVTLDYCESMAEGNGCRMIATCKQYQYWKNKTTGQTEFGGTNDN